MLPLPLHMYKVPLDSIKLHKTYLYTYVSKIDNYVCTVHICTYIVKCS